MTSTLLTGLVCYYKMDGNTNDELGNYNATNTGAASTEDAVLGTAYDFDGGTDKWDLGNMSETQNVQAISINFWAKTTGTPAGADGIIARRVGTIHWDVYFNGTSGDFTARFVTSGGTKYVSTTGVINSTYKMITIVVDGSITECVKVYFNGSLDTPAGSGFGTFSTLASSTQTTYLCSLNGSGYYPPMKVDELGIWSKALTTDEIAELYNSGSGLTYPFSASTPSNNSILFGVNQ